MDDLKQKITAVEEQHAEETLNTHLELHKKDRNARAHILLGGIRAVDRISENLSSQVMAALITFQKEDMHEELGFTRFADFLDQSEYSPMPKSEFYRRKELYDAEGGQLYDTFNAARIPISTRRLLAKLGDAEISIDGDEIVIGDERSDLSDLPTIKALIGNFASDNKKLLESKEKADKALAAEKDKNKRGTEELNELRRSIDAANEGTEYERALMGVIKAFITLTSEAKELPDDERAERGAADLQTIAGQYFALSDAFGVKRPLHDNRELQERVHNMKPVEEMTEEEKQKTFLDRASAIIDEEGGFEELD